MLSFWVHLILNGVSASSILPKMKWLEWNSLQPLGWKMVAWRVIIIWSLCRSLTFFEFVLEIYFKWWGIWIFQFQNVWKRLCNKHLLLNSTFIYRLLGEVMPHLGVVVIEWVGKHTCFLKLWLLRTPSWCALEIMIAHIYRISIFRSRLLCNW